jgi:hypothetical protein
MSMETSVILRSLLFQALSADDLQQVIDAIMVMCSEEDVAVVEKKIAEIKEKKKK